MVVEVYSDLEHSDHQATLDDKSEADNFMSGLNDDSLSCDYAVGGEEQVIRSANKKKKKAKRPRPDATATPSKHRSSKSSSGATKTVKPSLSLDSHIGSSSDDDEHGYDLPVDISQARFKVKSKAAVENSKRPSQLADAVLVSPASSNTSRRSRLAKTKSTGHLTPVTPKSGGGSLEKHLEQVQRTPGTTIATDPTAPLSPSESSNSMQDIMKKSKSLDRFLDSSLSLLDVPPPPPSPSKSPGWRIRESLKKDLQSSKPTLLEENDEDPSTPVSYRKKALRNTDQAQLPEALRLAASGGIKRTSRKLRVDTKLDKTECRLRQRSNSFDRECLEPDFAERIEQEIEAELAAEKLREAKVPQRPSEDFLATPSNAYGLDKTKKKPELKGALGIPPLSKDDLLRRRSDNDKHAPHNRPGVAHHKSELLASPTATPKSTIVDRIPNIVSWHARKLKDPSTDDESSLASFNSTLTPSVATRELDDDEENVAGNKEAQAPPPAPAKTDGGGRLMLSPARPRTKSLPSDVLGQTLASQEDRFFQSPVARGKSVAGPTAHLTTRQLARLSDASPTIPKRIRSIPVDYVPDDKLKRLQVPQASTAADQAPRMSPRIETDAVSLEDDAPSDEEMSIQLKDATTSSGGPLKRWVAKAQADLPPAFRVVAAYSKRSLVSTDSIEQDEESEDYPPQSLYPSPSAESLKELMPVPKGKSSKMHHQEEDKKVKQTFATEQLKHRISQMNEEHRIKTLSGHSRRSVEALFEGNQEGSMTLKLDSGDDQAQLPRRSLSLQHERTCRSHSAPRNSLIDSEPRTSRRRLRKDKEEEDTSSVDKELKKKGSTRDLMKKEGSKLSIKPSGTDEEDLSPSKHKGSKKPKNSDPDSLASESSHSRTKVKTKNAEALDDIDSSSGFGRVADKDSDERLGLKKRSKSMTVTRAEHGSSHSRSSLSSSGSTKSPRASRKSREANAFPGEKKTRSRTQSPSGKGKRQPKSLLQPEKLALWQIKQQLKHRVTPVVNVYNRRLDDDDDDEQDPSLPPAFRNNKSKKTKKTKKHTKDVKSDDQFAQERLEIEQRRGSVIEALGRLSQDTSNLPPAFRHLEAKPKSTRM